MWHERDFKRVCTLGFALSGRSWRPCHHCHVNRPRLASLIMRDMWPCVLVGLSVASQPLKSSLFSNCQRPQMHKWAQPRPVNLCPELSSNFPTHVSWVLSDTNDCFKPLSFAMLRFAATITDKKNWYLQVGCVCNKNQKCEALALEEMAGRGWKSWKETMKTGKTWGYC